MSTMKKLAAAVARMRKSRRSVYNCLADGQWHTNEDLSKRTGIARTSQVIYELRKSGFQIEMKRGQNVDYTHNAVWQYRLVSIAPKELVDEAVRLRQKTGKREKSRTSEWFLIAQQALDAARNDRLHGTTTPNPYPNAKNKRVSWQAVYSAMFENGIDLTVGFAESRRVKPAVTPRLGSGFSTYAREALIDWEWQSKGYVWTQTAGGREPTYQLDPSLTEEDKAFARRQMAICLQDLRRPGKLDAGVSP